MQQSKPSSRAIERRLLPFLFVILLCACEPSDRRPGLWLRGDVTELPQDWSFTDAFAEIYLEIKTPYWLPHSVTIWCAQVGGDLYIGARDPDSKNWPGWMEENPAIRLKIADKVYAATAAEIPDGETLTAVRAAYVAKYALPPTPDGSIPNVKYWAVVSR